MMSECKLLCLIICGLFISCHSPNDAEQTVPPILTITANTANLSIGDTLRLTLHIEAPTLRMGTVEFADSTLVTFTNLHSSLDTTLLHVYKANGTYTIKASFSNGNSTTVKALTVLVTNHTPNVTIVIDKKMMTVGDSVRVKLHAFDATLSGGTLYFHDGQFVSFSHLRQVFDTTISHVYTIAGSYSITATFSDGELTQSATDSVEVLKHYIALVFSIGMKWRFSYDYLNERARTSYYHEDQQGIHEWKIISSVITNQDTIFTLQQIRNDTRHLAADSYPHRIDTTTTICDTTFFTITASYSKVEWNWTIYWPSNSPWKGTIFTDVIPNHTFMDQYPLRTGNTTYDENGPVSYYYEFSPWGTGYTIRESLTLIDFTKP